MGKYVTYLEIEAGKRCPKCGGQKVKMIDPIKRNVPTFECADCKCKYTYSKGLVFALSYFIGIIIAGLIYYFFLYPRQWDNVLSAMIMLVLLVIIREVVQYLAYVLFNQTKMHIVKEK